MPLAERFDDDITLGVLKTPNETARVGWLSRAVRRLC
jgi:hypothetical protein